MYLKSFLCKSKVYRSDTVQKRANQPHYYKTLIRELKFWAYIYLSGRIESFFTRAYSDSMSSLLEEEEDCGSST